MGYDQQVGGMHPTGMLSGCFSIQAPLNATN